MRKILFFLVVGFLTLCTLSCGKSNKNVLYLYYWDDYIPPEVLESFEKETGIRVITDAYSTNEELFTKLMAGGDGYDVVIPATDYFEIIIKEDLAAKLDKTKLPNVANINPRILEIVKDCDPNNEYGVPYAISPCVIAVNKKYVTDYPRNATIFEDERYKGRMTMMEDMREALTSALAIEGYSQTTTNVEEIAKAAERVKKWKKNLAKFDSESFGKAFANGEFWVVHGFIDNITREMDPDMEKDVDLIIPDVGGTNTIDFLVMLKNAPNKENAYKFINYLHRPEIFAKCMDYLGDDSLNVPARALMKERPYFNIDDLLERTQTIRDIDRMLEVQNRFWLEIMLAD